MKQRGTRSASPLAIVALMSLGLIAFANSPARADTPAQQGWWTVTNPGPGPAGIPTPPHSPPPDVPSEGLLVQGGIDDPSAYAALVYWFPKASIIGDLTLRVTSGSATTSGSTLQVCPLTTLTLEPAQGGPIADAPRYDCSKHTTAMLEESGYQFNVASFASGSTLAVAILPTSAADRVVFDQPGHESLPVRAVTTGGSRNSPMTVTGPEATTVAPSFGGAPAVPSEPGAAAAVGGAAPVGATAPDPSAVGVGPPPDDFQLPRSTSSSADANPAAVAGMLVAVLVAGGLWSFAGRAAIQSSILADAEAPPAAQKLLSGHSISQGEGSAK